MVWYFLKNCFCHIYIIFEVGPRKLVKEMMSVDQAGWVSASEYLSSYSLILYQEKLFLEGFKKYVYSLQKCTKTHLFWLLYPDFLCSISMMVLIKGTVRKITVIRSQYCLSNTKEDPKVFYLHLKNRQCYIIVRITWLFTKLTIFKDTSRKTTKYLIGLPFWGKLCQ